MSEAEILRGAIFSLAVLNAALAGILFYHSVTKPVRDWLVPSCLNSIIALLACGALYLI